MKIKLVKIKDFRLFDLVKVALIVSVVLFMFSKFFFRVVSVTGNSMEPTLSDGETGFSNVFATRNGEFNRFEIVVAKQIDGKQVVKRIIGLPKETIQFREDKLYINGQYVNEPFMQLEFIKKQTFGNQVLFTQNFGPITLSEDEYFLMGDNRIVSRDSRTLGAYQGSEIIGKHLMIFIPLDNMRIIKDE